MRSKGTKLGRRPVKPAIEARIRELKTQGMGILKIRRKVGVGTSVVQRVLAQSQAERAASTCSPQARMDRDPKGPK